MCLEFRISVQSIKDNVKTMLFISIFLSFRLRHCVAKYLPTFWRQLSNRYSYIHKCTDTQATLSTMCYNLPVPEAGVGWMLCHARGRNKHLTHKLHKCAPRATRVQWSPSQVYTCEYVWGEGGAEREMEGLPYGCMLICPFVGFSLRQCAMCVREWHSLWAHLASS